MDFREHPASAVIMASYASSRRPFTGVRIAQESGFLQLLSEFRTAAFTSLSKTTHAGQNPGRSSFLLSRLIISITWHSEQKPALMQHAFPFRLQLWKLICPEC